MTDVPPIRISLADPAGEYRLLKDDLDAAVGRVMASGRYILGPEVEAFEKETAEYLGVAHACGVSSGTDAIQAALLALGIGPGDEVVTGAFSFFATAGAILRVGATPVFVDIEKSGFNADPAAVRDAVGERTRAVLLVHLFGQPVDVEAIGDLDVPVIEDAAQAFGAELGERKVGGLGSMGCFSFFPAKPLGCAGDGGLVSTDDSELAAILGSVRKHGAVGKNLHARPGGNFRLDPLQAAVLRVKLQRIDGWIATRRRYAELLRQRLAPLEAEGQTTLPFERPGTTCTWAQFVIRTQRRDDLRTFLGGRGIASEVYYPMPMPMQEVMGTLRSKEGAFPEAERAAGEVLAIPVHPLLAPSDVEEVAQAVLDFHEDRGRGEA
ncbi:MAG: DegT/DnrJ/EryC1/StrS family aminotransferase [Deltaproteobacteria bacterium]|nr:DegT/DnrJ/EryC1/StrS family aminotransferase [Deltaproteobacteria bacterium]